LLISLGQDLKGNCEFTVYLAFMFHLRYLHYSNYTKPCVTFLKATIQKILILQAREALLKVGCNHVLSFSKATVVKPPSETTPFTESIQ